MMNLQTRLTSQNWNYTGQFQLHHNHIDQRGDRRTPGFDNELSRFTVEWVALRVKIA